MHKKSAHFIYLLPNVGAGPADNFHQFPVILTLLLNSKDGTNKFDQRGCCHPGRVQTLWVFLQRHPDSAYSFKKKVFFLTSFLKMPLRTL